MHFRHSHPITMENIDLTWETTTTSNIGIDLGLLKGRITFTADAYYKYTTNLLMDIPLPSTARVSHLVRNEGEMSNKGIEFTVDSRNIEGEFKWETNFNISFNRNKVEKFTLQQVYYYGQTSEATSETCDPDDTRQTLKSVLGLYQRRVLILKPEILFTRISTMMAR